MKKRFRLSGILQALFFLLGCSILPGCGQPSNIRVEGGQIAIVINDVLHGKVVARLDGGELQVGNFSASEFVTTADGEIVDYAIQGHSVEDIADELGAGKRYVIAGTSPELRKELTIRVYDDFPRTAVYNVNYTNTSDADLTIKSWTNNGQSISANSSGDGPPLWSYQSGSYESRPDWILALDTGFEQQNYMGMNASDYGGGTPVSDVWRPDVGLAVGHLEMVPKLVSLPVKMSHSEFATLGVSRIVNRTLKPGESMATLQTFVTVHKGDFYQALTDYRDIMEKRGIRFADPLDSTYEPIWCAWGFERDFTMEQIYGALPIVKKLGYQWAVLDDGWQTAEGDWYLNQTKFPGGDPDMVKFVQTINQHGLRAKIWWAPLAVDPGTDLLEEHPEYLLLNEDGSKQEISWWNAYYLCPAYPPVQEYTKKLVQTIMQTWGYEGLKIDGQHLNGAPPCYNPAHDHADPEESVEKVPQFFKAIYETALAIQEDAVVEICPCGTAYSFFNLPYMNQPVASDPESSWQIRLKGKTLKALMGPNAAYYGDHVELSDGRNDFASTVGIGGVVGTKFTWPVGAKKDSRIDLTPDKEEAWAKWNRIYLDKMLPKGRYLGSLYDIGYDQPETHAISKDGKMYYAFYADSWEGEIELRGLDEGTYAVVDYVNGTDYGNVEKGNPKIHAEFENYLLLEANPTQSTN